jgi:N-acetylneuraminic acid mutarotase
LEELESRLAPASFAVNSHLRFTHLAEARALASAVAATASTSGAIVFFESSVANYQVLCQGLSAGTNAVILDAGGDGLKEMAAFLASRHGLTSIGVVAHGSPGAVELGTETLTEESLTRYSHELAALGSALAPGGELDLWSCDVAAGSGGSAFVRDLAALTGVAVAAADHAVGASALGGSWQLDVRAAFAQGKLLFAKDALQAFGELLGSWSSAASMATARSGHTTTLLGNGKVLVTWGSQIPGDARGALSSAELYDPVTNTWSSAGSMATARNGHTATLLNNGKVLVTGGSNDSGGSLLVLSSAELYNPVTDTWSSAGSMATARFIHTATLLGNGKVLVTGGRNNSGGSVSDLSSAEIYDPESNTWSSAGSIAAVRAGHTATLLTNGKVLVGGNDVSAELELYDPASNTWSAVASMPISHRAATLLSNGKVLFAGGDTGGTIPITLSTAELYDPVANSWASASSMGSARSGPTATLLTNGKVLVAGGFISGNPYSIVSTAELYDPGSDTWSSAGFLTPARESYTATLLSNGKVLVVGGYYQDAQRNGVPTASATLYDPGVWLDVAGFPATAMVGVSGSFTVTATNADGTTNASYIGSVHFTSSDPHAILPKDYTFTIADQGVHTFSAALGTRGTQSLTATDTKTRDITGSQWHYDPDPVDPSRSTITVTPDTIPSGGTATVTLAAKNAAGTQQTRGGWLFTFDWSAGGFINPGGGSFSNLSDNHDGTYTATFTGTTVVFPSTITITATINGGAVPPTTITVTPAVPATQLVIRKLSAVSVTAGDTVTFTVTAEDGTGTPVPSYTGTVQLASTDGQASVIGQHLPTSYTFVPSDHGTHTFTVTLATAGNQTITVTDQADHNLAATTSPITVSSPAKFLVNIPGGTTLVAGDPFLFTVQAVDASGKPLPSYSGPTTITAASSPPDPQGTFQGTLNSSGFGFFLGTLRTAGAYTLTVAAGSFSGTSDKISVTPSTANYFTISAPAGATTGEPFDMTVTAFEM